MKKAIITGLNGTLAPVLAKTLEQKDFKITGWDRKKISPDNATAIFAYLQEVNPDWVCHLAMGAEQWAQALASYCQNNNKGFLFTSTAMVFDHKPNGPHRVCDMRTSQDDYGRYKIRCENAINKVSQQAIIARIGWQIGAQRGGNNMLEALYKMMETEGVIQASTSWIPATSFMEDTCNMLLELMQKKQAGTYHLDSNAKSALNFFELVTKLKELHKENWVIKSNQDYTHDQRLVDERIAMPLIVDRL